MTQFSHKITTHNCQYRGEGNACLVVRFKLSEKEPKVLRLAKEDISIMNNASQTMVLKKLEDHIAIIRSVMQPLLGADFVHCPKVMPLSHEEVKIINEVVKNCRPGHRRNKGVKETDTYALVFPDFCSLPPKFSLPFATGPVICVEIKPKQGFCRSSKLNSSLNLPLCNFCMMQFHKMQKGQVSKRSQYCPLDLFSGCPKRMKEAVEALLVTPQNNFRIFQNEELVYCEEHQNSLNYILEEFFDSAAPERNHIPAFIELIVSALLRPFPRTKYSLDWKMASHNLKKCNNSSPACDNKGCSHKLPEGCILQRILKLQMLDNWNLHELYLFYLEMKKLHNSKQMAGLVDRSRIPLFLGEEEQSLSENNFDFFSRKIWEFLLALTLKDCSLMLTFQRVDASHRPSKSPPNQHVIKFKHGQSFLFSLAIIDLDMKTVDRVEFCYQLRQHIVESYLQAKRLQ